MVPEVGPLTAKAPKQGMIHCTRDQIEPAIRLRSLREICIRDSLDFKESPFNVNPDPRYLYLTRQIQEALAGLTYGIQNRKGFILYDG